MIGKATRKWNRRFINRAKKKGAQKKRKWRRSGKPKSAREGLGDRFGAQEAYPVSWGKKSLGGRRGCSKRIERLKSRGKLEKIAFG